MGDVQSYPYTITYCLKKARQIDSFFELPKDKQPPESIWDSPLELASWFDNLYSNHATQFEIDLNDVEG